MKKCGHKTQAILGFLVLPYFLEENFFQSFFENWELKKKLIESVYVFDGKIVDKVFSDFVSVVENLGFSFFSLINKLDAIVLNFLPDLSLQIKNIYEIIIFLFFMFLTIWGAKFPDYDLLLKHFLKKDIVNKRYYYHRQFTHSLFLTLFLFWYSIYSLNLYLFFFMYGYLIHLIGDMLTGSIPYMLYGDYRNGLRSRIGIGTILKTSSETHNKIALFFESFAPLVFVAEIIYIIFYIVKKVF